MDNTVTIVIRAENLSDAAIQDAINDMRDLGGQAQATAAQMRAVDAAAVSSGAKVRTLGTTARLAGRDFLDGMSPINGAFTSVTVASQAAGAAVALFAATSIREFAKVNESASHDLESINGSVNQMQLWLGEALAPAVHEVAVQLDLATEAARDFKLVLDSLPAGSEFGLAGMAADAAGLELSLRGAFEAANQVNPTRLFFESAKGAREFGEALGLVEEKSASLGPWLEAIARAQYAIANDGRLLQNAATDYATDLEHLAEQGQNYVRIQREQAAADEAQRDAYASMAEAAGLANERNTEAFHTLELGSGIAAEAAWSLDKVAEAQAGLAAAYQAGLAGMQAFLQQGSEYASLQSSLERGYDIIAKKQAAGVALTEQEQRFLERYPALYGRLEGAQEDASTQAALFAAANTEVMLAQDELNAAIARGDTNLQPYIDRLNDAKALAGDSAYADPMTQSLNTLSSTVSTVLVPALDDLTRKVEYISQPWLVEIDAATEAAEEELNRIIGLIQGINAGAYGVVAPPMGAPGEAFAEGGFVSGPTFALIGEAGPELVLPLSRPERMQELLRQAGVQTWAGGGGAGFGVAAGGAVPTGPHTGVGGVLRVGVEVVVNPVAVDWSWLFAGIDPAAADAGERMRDAVAGWFGGLDVDALVSGDLQARAEAALAELLTVRQIAVESGAGADVVAQLDAEIAGQRAELEAVGALLGTPIVAGLIAQAEAEQAGQRLLETIKAGIAGADWGALGGGDLPGALDGINDQIRELEALRGSATDLGQTELAAEYDAQLAALYEQRRLMAEIYNTESMQEYLAEQERVTAEQEAQLALAKRQAELAAQAQQNEVEIVQALAGGGAGAGEFIDGVVERYNAAKEALDWGTALGLSPEALAELEREYEDAAQLYHQLFASDGPLSQAALAGGLDGATLQALATMGGDWFDAWYDGLFGAGAAGRLRQGWTAISQEQFAQLAGLEPALEEMGAGWINQVVAGFTSGRLSFEQALQLMTDDLGNMSEAGKLALLELRDAYQNDLAAALASGEGVEAAQAQWDAFMVMLEQLAAANGLTVDQILADWERLGDGVPDFGTTLSGAGLGAGGNVALLTQPPPTTLTGFETISGLLAHLGELTAALEHLVDGDLDRTQADEFLSLMQLLQGHEGAFAPDLVSAIAAGLQAELGELGLTDAQAFGQAALSGAGLDPETLSSMGLDQATIDELTASLGESFLSGATDPLATAVGDAVATGIKDASEHQAEVIGARLERVFQRGVRDLVDALD